MTVNSVRAFIPISDLSVTVKTGDISGDSSSRGTGHWKRGLSPETRDCPRKPGTGLVTLSYLQDLWPARELAWPDSSTLSLGVSLARPAAPLRPWAVQIVNGLHRTQHRTMYNAQTCIYIHHAHYASWLSFGIIVCSAASSHTPVTTTTLLCSRFSISPSTNRNSNSSTLNFSPPIFPLVDYYYYMPYYCHY